MINLIALDNIYISDTTAGVYVRRSLPDEEKRCSHVLFYHSYTKIFHACTIDMDLPSFPSCPNQDDKKASVSAADELTTPGRGFSTAITIHGRPACVNDAKLLSVYATSNAGNNTEEKEKEKEKEKEITERGLEYELTTSDFKTYALKVRDAYNGTEASLSFTNRLFKFDRMTDDEVREEVNTVCVTQHTSPHDPSQPKQSLKRGFKVYFNNDLVADTLTSDEFNEFYGSQNNDNSNGTDIPVFRKDARLVFAQGIDANLSGLGNPDSPSNPI